MRYMVDNERVCESVRSPRPTFDDGETLLVKRLPSAWKEFFKLLLIIVFGFAAFMGIAFMVGE